MSIPEFHWIWMFNYLFLFVQQKGRAIQVEDTTTGRQPTMDLRRPRLRDSDVVIQV